MIDEKWFSTRVRFAIIIDTKGLVRYSDSIYLLKAGDFEGAFLRSLEIGRKNEKDYLNADGQRVVWKLTQILALDIIQSEVLDGIEIYSEPMNGTDSSWTVDQVFHPELSCPEQTV